MKINENMAIVVEFEILWMFDLLWFCLNRERLKLKMNLGSEPCIVSFPSINLIQLDKRLQKILSPFVFWTSCPFLQCISIKDLWFEITIFPCIFANNWSIMNTSSWILFIFIDFDWVLQIFSVSLVKVLYNNLIMHWLDKENCFVIKFSCFQKFLLKKYSLFSHIWPLIIELSDISQIWMPFSGE